ncbi:MAG: 4Fe-4S dicluster domain-containing protein [Desulfovibrio sp.]|jgi:Fe-S-cluster-containing dehydrogenase component|nr:4Fe-4S dicluster domain-containing protein [Desulfovibrio sp.]
MRRRKFLSLISAGGLGTAFTPKAGTAAATFSGHPETLGVLHDSALCIGCRKCEAACREVNNLPTPDKYKNPEKPFADLSVLARKRRTDFQKFTVVNKYRSKDGRTVFRKFQCNHCQEPACASACFVRALVKTPQGPVIYKPDLCVGCRYCMIACPYYVPAYDYGNAGNPLIYKCTMCAPRLERGQAPGCVEICPTDALVFGRRPDLLELARARIAAHPGRYTPRIYGEQEMGGTNWLYLSPVPHEELGQPRLGKITAPELTSGALGAVAMIAGLWPVFLGGLYCISRRRDKIAEQDAALAAATARETAEAEARERLRQALAKAEKEKDAAIASEVKKAREEAIRELEEKAAPQAKKETTPPPAGEPSS